MKGTILLKEMESQLKIGVEQKERIDPQAIFFDIEIGMDITDAAMSQNIEETVNYNAVQRVIEQFLENKDYILLEKVASDVAVLLLKEFPRIEEITLTCWKPQALQKKNVKNVGIKISKKRNNELVQTIESDE